MIPFFFLIVLILVIAIVYKYKYTNLKEGFNNGDPASASKCFSCEQQDYDMGIAPRDYGSKCISCEVQDRSAGIFRGYGIKWA